MEALRAQSPTSGFQIETVPIPTLGPNDVLIKVAVAGISPGVVRLTRMGKSHTPSTVGHEAAGTIAAVGDNVKDLAVGSRVRLHPMLSCGQCLNCIHDQDNLCDDAALMGFARFGKPSALYNRYHDGTIAEYVRAPRQLIDQLPENVSMEVGAKVHDVATALRALKLAEITHESTIVITAASGTMGTLTLKLAHLFPIKKIILVGRSRPRLEQILKLSSIPTELLITEETGPDNAPAQALVPLLLEIAPEGIDAIIDYLPSGDILPRILPALRNGGALVHMGGNPKSLPIPLILIMNSCWKLTGGRANAREDVVEVLKWLEEGKLEVEDLITHRFDFGEVHNMLDLLENRGEPVWLSVLHMKN